MAGVSERGSRNSGSSSSESEGESEKISLPFFSFTRVVTHR